MARKKIPNLMDELLTGKPSKQSVQSTPSVPSKPRTQRTPSKPGTVRHTFHIDVEYLEKIKAVAYWERKQITEVMADIMAAYFADKNVRSIRKK